MAGNLTRGPDDRWTALDARHLYRHAKTAGFLYQAELRRELTLRLGLEWEPVERGTADIEGVPREVIEHFSQRRAEVLEQMAAHGGRSAQSAQIAALETRRTKQDLSVDRLREQWRARAAEHGLTAPALERVLQPGDRAVPWVTAVGPEALTREVSVFGRAELLQALAGAQPRGASIANLEQVADAMLTDREIVPLPHGRVPAGLTEARFTTGELLASSRISSTAPRARPTASTTAGTVRRSTRCAAARSNAGRARTVITARSPSATPPKPCAQLWSTTGRAPAATA